MFRPATRRTTTPTTPYAQSAPRSILYIRNESRPIYKLKSFHRHQFLLIKDSEYPFDSNKLMKKMDHCDFISIQ